MQAYLEGNEAVLFPACAPQVKDRVGFSLNDVSTGAALPRSRQYFLRRTIVLGFSVFAASILSGIAMIFWRNFDDSLFTMPAVDAYQLLIQATVGPVFIGLYFLWPVTLPVMFVLTMMVYVGSQLRRIWLSATAYALMGIYWLWLVKLMADGAFD